MTSALCLQWGLWFKGGRICSKGLIEAFGRKLLNFEISETNENPKLEKSEINYNLVAHNTDMFLNAAQLLTMACVLNINLSINVKLAIN